MKYRFPPHDPHCRVRSLTVRIEDKYPGKGFEKHMRGRREMLVFRWSSATETHVTATLTEVRDDDPVSAYGW